jgi:hypothetical protein
MPRSIKDRTKRIRDALYAQLLKHETDDTLPTTHRFLFYELIALSIIDKHRDSGRADSETDRQLTILRERGDIPWDWIADETRSLEHFTGFPSVGAGLLTFLTVTKLDPWRPQGPPLILTESRSLAGALRDLAREYRVLLAATNGQCGGFLHTEVGPALVPRQRVLYLGDYDLAGNDIEYNTRKVLERIVGGELAW